MFTLNEQKFSGASVLPLVEGGKGISISNGETCGAWAAAGGIGTFSAVNADSYDDLGNVIPQIYYKKNREERHRELIEYAVRGGVTQAKIARERSNGHGRVHMNVMWEMGGSNEITTRILSEAKGCIDGIACGAGMPYGLGEIASSFGVYYYPIVSSARAFSALYRRSFHKYIEFLGGVIYEDPWRAGGHNGLSNAEDPKNPINPYLRLLNLRRVMNDFELFNLPIIIAGNVWWLSEWEDYIDNKELGNVAFQFGTRPILTQENPVAKNWHKKFMSLKEDDVKLTRFSPTGFYSSAINTKMLQNLFEQLTREVEVVEKSSLKMDYFGSEIFLDEKRSGEVKKWQSEGFTEIMLTPDNTVIFVTKERAQEIRYDQKNCCGCLSACKFSSWSQSKGSTGKMPDPRTFCIQKTLQNIAHGGDVEDNLMFSGHMAYRFATDPFYLNNFIPTTKELIDRILTGF